NCAAVLATLDEFEARDIIGGMKESSARIERGLVGMKEHPFVTHVRGEAGGMVWGVEFADHGGKSAAEWANAFVLAGYQGDGPGGDGVHLLGPLSKKVVRISPPLTITPAEATEAMALITRAAARLADAGGRG
ncbi:MAG TPA: aminotransferase class III-fold pyridoxal phosphate-dependent enzyme, partial [Urbifossiella sp.]|nr:aminotransferase class III-fold pyridoxal phosphate-dependent enzyme [Urbifossiella sp.]